MSAAVRRLEAVPARSIPAAPIVPALTPLRRRRYVLPRKFKTPEPPPIPTMNPTLVTFRRTEPVSAYDGEATAVKKNVAARRPAQSFAALKRPAISTSRSHFSKSIVYDAFDALIAIKIKCREVDIGSLTSIVSSDTIFRCPFRGGR